MSQDKRQQVREEIRAAGKVIIAFSGGVDSTLLAQVASRNWAGIVRPSPLITDS